MSEQKIYDVLRQHYSGEQHYEGEQREMTERDAKQLVDLGVLREAGKAEPELQTKMEPAAITNKAKAKPSQIKE